jgi:hypothetical protein
MEPPERSGASASDGDDERPGRDRRRLRLNDDERLRRREAARRRTRRNRRMAAGVLLLAFAALGGAVVSATGGRDGGDGRAGLAGAARRSQPAPPKPPELPGGGRRILPDHRVVGFYGAPQDDQLGILGVGTLTRAGRRLHAQARKYRAGGRRVLPAFELIAVIASGAPGADGQWRYRQTDAVVRRHLRAARRADAILVLDIQPGRSPFIDEVRHFRRWLKEPDVSLAIDPEWSMRPGQVPGRQIGSTDAATVNDVSAYLADIVKRGNLPQKLLIVHQFTDDMIQNKPDLRRREGVALVLNVDGFGNQPNKISKYDAFTSGPRRTHYGFKLFYEEDTDLMTPREVLRLRPRPDVVMYE